MNDTEHWWNDIQHQKKNQYHVALHKSHTDSPGTEPGPLQAPLHEEIHNDTNTMWYELINSCEMGSRFINTKKHKLHAPDI